MSGFNSLNKNLVGGPVGSLSVNPFGSLNTAEQTPAGQATFVYGINVTQWVTSSTGAGAAVTTSEGIVSCSTGTSLSGSASVRLRRGMKYRAGQGGVCKLTALFEAGVTGATSIAGLGNPECGYYFARANTNFGILHLATGKKEIRKLTVSAAAGTENVTITLDGKPITFSIAGGSNINQTSFLISEQDYSQVGTGWDAESIDGEVYFISNRALGTLTGTYGIATSGTVSGSFSVVQAGVGVTQTFISQSSWNIDKMDGNGDSRIILDPSKGNVYSIGYQYLGFGNAIFSIEDPNKGVFVPVHQIKNANARNTVVLRNPHIFARWSAVNNGSSTSVTIKGASAATFTEGRILRNIGPAFATGSVKSGVGTTIVPLLTIRPNQVFNGQSSYGEIDPYNISIGVDSGNASGTDILNVYVYKNATLTGPVNFQNINSSNSICAGDAAATGITVTSNAQLLKAFSAPPNSAITLTLSEGEFYLGSKDRLTIAAAVTGNNAKVATNISWYEDQ